MSVVPVTIYELINCKMFLFTIFLLLALNFHLLHRSEMKGN